MPARPLTSNLWALHPEHLLLAAAIALGPFREHRDYSLGLTILWLSLHWIRALWAQRNLIHRQLTTIVPGIALGLLLIQTRMLLTMEDHEGPTRYMLIAFALLVGSNLSLASWKRLLQWITAGSLAVSIFFLVSLATSNGAWLGTVNKDVFGEGYGGINMLGSVLNIFTVLSAYTLRISKNNLIKLLAASTFFTSYALCLASNSRMTAVAPLLALFIAWITSEGWKKLLKLSNPFRPAAILFVLSVPAAIYWYGAILPDIGSGMKSDIARLNIWQCSLENSIFAGNNRIAYGNGFQWKPIQEACGHWQAHSSYVHFLSMHGLLGLIALAVIMLIVFKGIRDHLRQSGHERSLWHSSWGEVALGSTLVVMITAVSSTTYLGGYLNPFLIGLMLSMGLAPLPRDQSKPEADQGEARINAN